MRFSPGTVPPKAKPGCEGGHDTMDASKDGDAAVLFEPCRYPRHATDLLDCVVGYEPWQEAKTAEGRKVRVLGDASSLRKLFSLSLTAATEALCLHRIGDCLIVLDAEGADSERGDEDTGPSLDASSDAGTYAHRRSYSPGPSSRCQVRMEGDMVRVYPCILPAEPVDIAPPPAVSSPAGACCEWLVREGLSLVAVTAQPHGADTVAAEDGPDVNITSFCSASPRQRAASLPSFDDPNDGAMGGNCIRASDDIVGANVSSIPTGGCHMGGDGGGGGDFDLLQTQWPSLPTYHRRLTDECVAVLVVRLGEIMRTQTLVDAWLSCCLLGSPSLLCFFVDDDGVCRGCRAVAGADIPMLGTVAASFRADQRCLTSDTVMSGARDANEDSNVPVVGVKAFEPRNVRENTRSLLETLVTQCDRDGGHCLVLPGPLGSLRLFGRHPGSGHVTEDESCEDSSAEGEPWRSAEVSTLALLPFKSPLGSKAVLSTGLVVSSVPASPPSSEATCLAEDGSGVEATARDAANHRVRRAHFTQALLMYHAAVRLAQARPPPVAADTEPKGVPIGSRWTTKSCQHPLRVRQMMFRAVRALRVASRRADDARPWPQDVKEEADRTSSVGDVGTRLEPQPRFLLLLSSAYEFIADSFLAESLHGCEAVDALRRDATRHVAALRHLKRSSQHLAEYVASFCIGGRLGEIDGSSFSQSVGRLEERVIAKRANAHMSLARVRQRQPWRDDGPPHLRAIGQALQELDAAEALVANPPRVAVPTRALGPYDRSLLASISKWKADLLLELAALCGGISRVMEASPTPGGGGGSSVVRGFCGQGGGTGSADMDAQVREYLEAQQVEIGESPQPLPVQQERWLQSAISLSLRSLHQLTTLPDEVTDELLLQSRGLLARAYGDLGHIYAGTGRYTKAMTHAKQGIELFNATKDKYHAALLQIWLCRLQLRMAVPQAAACDGADFDAAMLRGFAAVTATEDAACSQVVTSLQRALKGLEDDNESERCMRRECQALLGKVFLRQGLSRLACASPLCAACRLCEKETALPGVLELLQAAEQPGGVGVDLASSSSPARESVDLLLQASACLHDAGDGQLAATAHACLAAVYLCGGQDGRVQRLVLAHSQHAQEHLQQEGASASAPALRVAVQLLEAKALRRAGSRSSSTVGQSGCGPGGGCCSGGGGGGVGVASGSLQSRGGDVKATLLLCDIAIGCLRSAPSAGTTGGAQEPGTALPTEAESGAGPPADARDDQRVPVMSYLKQELGDVLVRLLRLKGDGAANKQLKDFYCSLITAWHAETGQVEALVALQNHLCGLGGGDLDA
eukprot:TRINITY_DN30841_c0_g1_i1.p1 TRINITY_DN30841_c0_g1~~TRINITY_DN30841_c0_g1_i1.p1  ORF type:complete len:1317 (+),score=240.23 TRINITY_DN30841_c0_g1_i1:59-4009(+)